MIQITEDLWVNPSAVASVAVNQEWCSSPQPTDVQFVGGRVAVVHKPLHEVVALINGSA